ncbi:exodeoxyribonuclease V subunit alpha [Spectribacter hydrogenoxidans]|uniref:RecBCD enzyme subunit RecD n=1 Tax=Spectribacter hydrogenoxidans TaxID=3075608 RepID=A0ABU3BZZ7_9GAMM|nr:exodeoxyribonuclease V subunit alpha [Salinisphaera sp. W335]MDT0634891.1 exodeoxyribonuclease V subunit alpha [Salinisphaera sp. W335]
MSDTLRTRMQRAVDERRAAPLEAALADWALRHGGSQPVAVALAACARAVADGHSCLSLAHALPAIPGEHPFCDRDELERALQSSELVGAPGESRPLIREEERLYLHRYWTYEARLAERLRRLLAAEPDRVDTAALQPDGGLFDYGWVGDDETHWQAVAAFVALRHRFAVISGGPGTGKTYTVLRLMRLLIESALRAGEAPPLIRMAAPTGKAAARMVESTRAGLTEMPDLPEAVRTHIPLEAGTLHRLIGIGYGTTRPRHDRDNPLAADVVIVDEASMVDLPLMAKLVEALSDQARLILLGDRYQLASVESGSVLAELCSAAGVNRFTSAQQEAAAPLLADPMENSDSPLADHVVTLQTSHRFQADSPIGRLAAAVNDGDGETALAIAADSAPDITLNTDTGGDSLDELVEAAAERYQALIDTTEPQIALEHLQSQCLLCAVRHGPTGSVTLNRRITERLAQQRGFDPRHVWYHGRPVMVTRNDYRAGLYNGDIGVCLRDEEGHLRVWFATDEGLRAFLPTALPDHESVYAITVHKSQGSEFDHVTLVLPLEDNKLLTRELIYTGITRARMTVRLFGSGEILTAAIQRRIERHSGLSDRMREASHE